MVMGAFSQAQGELPAGKDLGVAAALIDAFEGAVTRAKVERSRSPFDSFKGFVLSALVA
ncbi:TetR family transcriptional regulator C-terminal domain-containing protein (plasmid) [Rhizobium sp. CB3060]|uniref:TetR family transcriptional regulator C-terminal domain-containing protein n=1 Tax=Rhizobium sp. CB3060 TaxID=3138255 RepID=UPI0021A402AE|nr:TetR family transcriptional regulator C-terminal domain-containing protein [Rhizobium tropici]UWU24763.1 TetR family transcriptional regulator C-terminal domain-containing protein [Rhizobium tropici]